MVRGPGRDIITLPLGKKDSSPKHYNKELSQKRIGKIINLPKKPLGLDNITIQLEEDADISLYAMVKAVDNKYIYLLRIIDLNYYSPEATPQSLKIRETVLQEEVGPETAMSHFFSMRIARAELVDVTVKSESGYKLIGPKRIPLPGTPVYVIEDFDKDLLIGTQEDPIYIGNLMDTNISATIDLQKLSRHMLIIGSTGTGKSWLRGVLMERIYELGVPQLIFDPLRDYVEAVDDLGGVNLRYGVNFMPSLISLPTEAFASMLKGVLTPLQMSLAVRGFIRFKQKGKEEPERLIKYIEEVAKEMNAHSETEANTIARVESLLRELGYITPESSGILNYVSSQGKSLNILSEDMLAELISNRKLVNIDLHGINDLAFQTTVASVLNQILSLRKKNKIDPIIVSFDEAHRIAPRVKSHSESPPSLPIIKDLVRFGRHYGIGLIAITQYPDSVDIELVRLPATRVIFALDSDQLGAIRGLLGDLPEYIRDNLPKLEKGTAFLSGTIDVVRHTLYVRITGERKTTHGGKTPKFRTIKKQNK